MQTILGAAALGARAPTADLKDAQNVNKDDLNGKNSEAPYPETSKSKSKLRPVLSGRRTRRLSLEADKARATQSSIDHNHLSGELHEDLVMKYEVEKSKDEDVTSGKLVADSPEL